MRIRSRHLAKSVTWRLIASFTTYVLTLVFFSEDPRVAHKALEVAVVEGVSKIVLYYYHERVWYLSKPRFRVGVRHIFKTLTWRAIASFTTFVIAFLMFSSDSLALEKASGLAIVESLLKMLLYYLHERAWQKEDEAM